MKNYLQSVFWITSVVTIFAVIIVYLIPFILNVNIKTILFYINNNYDSFGSTLVRTFCFAAATTILSVVFGFVGAILIRKIKLYSLIGNGVSILLIPFLLGNISIAFLYKLLLLNSSFFLQVMNNEGVYHLILLISIQVWQFGFLFIYLFWLNINNIPNNIINYARTCRLNIFTKLKVIYLPQSKNLFILLIIIGFVFNFYEHAKSQFILKASQGVNTELIANWLYRNYQSKLVVNPNYAISDALSLGLVLVSVSLSFLLCFVFLFNFLSKKVIQLNKSKTINRVFIERNIINTNYIYLVLMSFIILLPIILLFIKSNITIPQNLNILINPILFTIVAAIVSTIIAILFGISSRIGWLKYLKNINSVSMLFIVFLYGLLLVPPLCIMLSGFRWMSIIGYNNMPVMYTTWIFSHAIILLPLLGSFLLTIHYRISNFEFSYLKTINIKISEIFKYIFVKRFKLEYLLTLILAFSFIWNESTLNKVFSDRIPSFTSILEMYFTGRGADYSIALTYFLISLILSIIGVLLWITINQRNKIYFNEKNNIQ